MSRRRSDPLDGLLAETPSRTAFAAICRYIDRRLHRDPVAQSRALGRAAEILAEWPNAARLATPTAAARLVQGDPRPADSLARHVELRKAGERDVELLGSDLGGRITMLSIHLADGARAGDQVANALRSSPLHTIVDTLVLAFGYGSVGALAPLFAEPWPRLAHLDLSNTRCRLDVSRTRLVGLAGLHSLVLRDRDRWADAPMVDAGSLDALLRAPIRLDHLVLGRVPRAGPNALRGLDSGESLVTFDASGWPLDDRALATWTRLGSRLESLVLDEARVTADGMAQLLARATNLRRLRVRTRTGAGDDLCRSIADLAHADGLELSTVSLRAFGPDARPVTSAGMQLLRDALPAATIELEAEPGVTLD